MVTSCKLRNFDHAMKVLYKKGSEATTYGTAHVQVYKLTCVT